MQTNRGYCVCCNRWSDRLQGHHIFFHATKHPERKKLVNDEINIAQVCPYCHGTDGTGGGEARSRKFKEEYWKRQILRYGEKIVKDWYDSVPYLVKENYE